MNTADAIDHGIDHGAAVLAETARFAALLEGAEMAASVPTCPGWTLADLTRHAGGVQRWFSVLLRQRVQERPTSRDVDLRLPQREDEYADWLRAGAAEAAEVFAATDPDAPMWVWGADARARFWVRRMLFETLVHRVDAERTLGVRSEIDPVLAQDGVDEFLVNLPFATPFAPKVAHLRDSGRTIRFQCTDGEGRWLVRLRPDGFGVAEDADAGPADATVRAGAADLLQLLYGRLDRTAGAIGTTGDEDLLDLWFANSEF
ncbi:maleylpyruvate isomerase family mycothiol-dependent enzyme [Streptomyces sp. NBC_00249]|uniref:maleylpyruvate isomerase family mycothiol-dependent enzyme n=1 Tax=Streptomyces sp. NBC_00249 TaxID=2975690 RepID=UPI00224D90B1|nr:maleylpyruvate isomerase family mycothiol-dependent enzyme [Streptomyces sp. NBC_00249]MCX5195530.1 maleylpyruvate isomerase family mycothiol-dependent enzyme [Streptomyces sp. NBC_00249]